MPFPRRSLPPLARVQQKLSSDHIDDVRRQTKERLIHSGLIAPNQKARIAITAGSRGIGGFIDLLAGIIDAVKSAGGDPFIIPAMGSHGGATSEGQTEILRRFGVTEETVGAPLHANMHTHALGTSETGAIAHLDDLAAQADGVIVLGRVKTYPENAAGVASGLLKMVTVGLGKQAGAQEAHTHGLWPSVKAVPKLTMTKTKIICGVAVVENAFHQPVQIEIVEPSYGAFKDADERWLELGRAHVGEISFQQMDLLIVD